MRRALMALICTLAGCGGAGGATTADAAPPDAAPALLSLQVGPTGLSVELGVRIQLTATGLYDDGTSQDLTAAVAFSSGDVHVATVDAAGRVWTAGTGATTLIASLAGTTGAATLSVTPRAGFGRMGVWVYFDERGWPSGYYNGDLLHLWNDVDPLGHHVADEVGLQLDEMQAIGIGTIVFELRAADDVQTGDFSPPGCELGLSLGPSFLDPDPTDLANLGLLLDELDRRGMRMWLVLNNTHMELSPPTASEAWLTAILSEVRDRPALDLVLFGGAEHLVSVGDTQVCGIPAEAPLWEGPGSVVANYVEWAIGLGLSLGLPARKLSAELVVSSFNINSETPAPPAVFTDGHLWRPIETQKAIFDDLAIPAGERTYAVSVMEESKCWDNGQNLPCDDLLPYEWADETLAGVRDFLGADAHIVVCEMGDTADPTRWTSERALEGLSVVFAKYGVEAGALWRWTNSQNDEDSDPHRSDPVRRRGTATVFTPQKDVLVDVAGWHLPPIANASFEGGGGTPDGWLVAGDGTASRLELGAADGIDEVPWRGTHALRLVTGQDMLTATSAPVVVTPGIVYTTTANLRFAWTGDPDPGAAPTERPRVRLSLLYYQANGSPSAVRVADSFAWYQEDATAGFATFPVQYVPPADAATVEVQVAAERHGLPGPITLDVDQFH